MNDTDLLEANAISFEILESMADAICSKLCKIVNEKLVGTDLKEVSYEIILNDSSNAGVYYDLSKIVITTGMVRSIYQDALNFPLYSIRVSKDFNIEELVNKVYYGNEFIFDGGIPEIPDCQLTEFSNFYKNTWIEAGANKTQEIPAKYSFDYPNALSCRFLMFELMMVWVFYHEFAHYTQKHNLLQKGAKTHFESSAFDILDSALIDEKYLSQAREVLADTDAMLNTLRYLLSETKRIHPGSLYLLVSVQACMFIRFYKNKNSNYTNDISVGYTHPHPAVRNTFLQLIFIEAMMWDVRKNMSISEEKKESFLVGFKYIAGRANLFSVAYYTARYSIEEDDRFNFLYLIGRENKDKLQNEVSIIVRFVNSQLLDIIKNTNENENHIHFLTSVNYFKRIGQYYPEFFEEQGNDRGEQVVIVNDSDLNTLK
ncbi:hypothetical protein ACU9SG_003940 [Serratia marcescens]|uniref:hypothetical protein n=1 Tax=Serratia marcescens TaxID=615 RepID=UPI0007450BF2|nr:hypothetical protein [Serratia marcescens]MBH3208031.1 hypothetical protein [Serratia marcescens]NCI54574.1 hypothetical protein [Serratia marcescens]NDJ08411.1 hypothetical protein [Serratia marcescens]NDJ31456.1 hypothetical protein [Serratia marcescens]NDJ42976.1 hypothetical protein [Serratia marcescens]